MNRKIVYLTIAVCTLLAILCSCTSSNGDSLLEVVAGVKGVSSEDAPSRIQTSSSITSSDTSSETSSEASSETSSYDESMDVIPLDTEYSTPKDGYVNTQSTGLVLRNVPSQNYDYENSPEIPKGKDVKVLGESGNYYYVEYNGKKGFVTKAYIGFKSDTTTSEATTSVSNSDA